MVQEFFEQVQKRKHNSNTQGQKVGDISLAGLTANSAKFSTTSTFSNAEVGIFKTTFQDPFLSWGLLLDIGLLLDFGPHLSP